MRSRHGFTLIEILLALGVIAILAAVLLPVANSATERSNSVACMANLKALWNAQRSYQNDHSDTFIPYTDTESWAWTAKLMAKGYLPQPTKVFFCVAFSKATDLTTPESVALRTGGQGEITRRGTYSHYGYNYYHLGSSIRYGGDTGTPARGAQVSQPARTILFIDTIISVGAQVPRGSFLAVDRADTAHVPDPRHRGSIQMVFVDGHAEAFKPADTNQLYAPYPAGLGRATQDGSLWKR